MTLKRLYPTYITYRTSVLSLSPSFQSPLLLSLTPITNRLMLLRPPTSRVEDIRFPVPPSCCRDRGVEHEGLIDVGLGGEGEEDHMCYFFVGGLEVFRWWS